MEPGEDVKTEPPCGATARKLRKQKMAAARASSSTEKTSREKTHSVSEEALPPKKRRFVEVKQEPDVPAKPDSVSSTSGTNGNCKKVVKKQKGEKGATQMRYEPDVPMTKEEVSAWRKEQRKVRNRESAAASRQKTRQRITELEAALEVWKAKYDDVSRQLRELQESTGRARSGSDCSEDMKEVVCCSEIRNGERPGLVSPSSSPPSSPEPWSGEATSETNEAQVQEKPQVKLENPQHLIETISRPA